MIEQQRSAVSTFSRSACAALCLLFVSVATPASDHADTNLLTQLKRHDARIGDFYLFTRGEGLVMAMTIFGAPDDGYDGFHFHPDVVYRFHIDRDSPVTFRDGADLRMHGGTIINPAGIAEDVVVTLRFREDGASYSLETSGLLPGPGNSIKVFAGIRDEPFIRGTRIGKNMAAIVVELPLSQIVGSSEHAILLGWSTTDLLRHGDPQDELAGRAYRSQFAEQLNFLHPSEHAEKLGLPPDVVIFDTRKPAAFPNGRDLVDDVLDLLGRQGAPNNPSENDVEFLTRFPYLSPPQTQKH